MMGTLGSSQVRPAALVLGIALCACNATDSPVDGGSIGEDAGSGGGARGGDGGRSGSAGGAGTAGSAGSASCAPCLAEALDWGNTGGFVARNDRSTLSPCNAYQHMRTTLGGGAGAPALTCDRMLPCMGSGLHGIGDVIRALEHPDVQAALAKGTALFGVDSRPVDGQVFEIMVGQDTITVGSPCPPPSSSCTPIPPGVSMLAQLLRDIDEEQLNLAPCTGMFD